MNSYLLFKSLHLIAVVSWMAGLLYLPRIFVYHVENKQKKEATDIFEVMEKRLFFFLYFQHDKQKFLEDIIVQPSMKPRLLSVNF